MTNAEVQHWIKSCLRKARYGDEEKALRSVDRCQRERPGVHLRIYACDYCHGWHLTKVRQQHESVGIH
ncbi:hypothetical protein [Hydrocarboniphaga effusa]|uniref:hypothetical protein n=1 Tax=Hydrocarboniphaga effusa TaxID=243629 RepID=UPI003BAB12E4